LKATERFSKIVQKISVFVRLKAQRRTCSRNFENRQWQISDRSRDTLQVLRLIGCHLAIHNLAIYPRASSMSSSSIKMRPNADGRAEVA
jgi:hypothetical protein